MIRVGTRELFISFRAPQKAGAGMQRWVANNMGLGQHLSSGGNYGAKS